MSKSTAKAVLLLLKRCDEVCIDAEKSSFDTVGVSGILCNEISVAPYLIAALLLFSRGNSKLLANRAPPYYNIITNLWGGDFMETKDVIRDLRIKKGLSQEELAERVYVRGRLFRAGRWAKPHLTQKR